MTKAACSNHEMCNIFLSIRWYCFVPRKVYFDICRFNCASEKKSLILMRFLSLLFLCVLAFFSRAEDVDESPVFGEEPEELANLIVQKTIVSDYHFLAIGQNFSVVINIYNVGNKYDSLRIKLLSY